MKCWKVGKRTLLAMLKLKMSPDVKITISAVPLEVTFHFLHPWTLCQKNAPQTFERQCSDKSTEKNVKDSRFWASCIAGILRERPLTTGGGD